MSKVGVYEQAPLGKDYDTPTLYTGFKLVMFTNQNGVGRGKVPRKQFQDRATSIIKSLGLPIQVFAALQQGFYRKPCVGMWQFMVCSVPLLRPLQLFLLCPTWHALLGYVL